MKVELTIPESSLASGHAGSRFLENRSVFSNLVQMECTPDFQGFEEKVGGVCVCVPHGMIHHGADPNPRFRKPSVLEAFPFGNLSKLELDVHHPSPGPILQARPACICPKCPDSGRLSRPKA